MQVTKQQQTREHTITVNIKSTLSSINWWMTVVYGPQGDNAKMQFLQEIKNLRDVVQRRWIVIGDFNMILNQQDE